MVHRFKIKPFGSPYYTHDGEFYFWAYVFDTKKEMYEWYVDEVRKREVADNKDWDTYKFGGFHKELNFEAMCLPFEIVCISPDGGETRHSNIGNVIFHRGSIGGGVVAHEMGHCAMWFERLINGNTNAVFGDSNDEKEERLLYLLHDFVKLFYQKCRRKKII